LLPTNQIKKGKVQPMKMAMLSSAAAVLLLVGLTAPAKAATLTISFDQLSKVYLNTTYSTKMADGQYFGFGSFIGGFNPTTATLSQANILSVLRDNTKWIKSFETSYKDSAEEDYIVSATTGTADSQYAFVIYINDTLANVQTALAGSGAGITTQFGVFTYSNTEPSLRADLPQDPNVSPGDQTSFDTQFTLGAAKNNFTAVSGLGAVSASGIALIPEPTTSSLFLLGAGLMFLRRKSAS
jgi:hypothetical protein